MLECFKKQKNLLQHDCVKHVRPFASHEEIKPLDPLSTDTAQLALLLWIIKSIEFDP